MGHILTRQASIKQPGTRVAARTRRTPDAANDGRSRRVPCPRSAAGRHHAQILVAHGQPSAPAQRKERVRPAHAVAPPVGPTFHPIPLHQLTSVHDPSTHNPRPGKDIVCPCRNHDPPTPLTPRAVGRRWRTSAATDEDARRPVSAADRHPIATVPSIHRPGDVWLPGPDRFGFVCPRCHHATPWLVTQTSHLGGGRPALAGPCCDTVPRSTTRTVRRAS